ncbi:ninjurin-1-like [Copidosoma floridanum]|uniref:ninjurin-1-like n=1 Tax=Copidosoma floridanum TaxID=29053 RepID=UPI0006C9D9D6|nr:ninjurin-1-like [Copidosoma floridanum]
MGGFFPGGVESPTNVNVYQQKKTIAQGMMDLALISANANQFRYVLQNSGRHPYYYPSLVMISLSLFLQVIVGIGLIWNSRYNVLHEDQMCKANRANNWTVIAIFLVTILNVFISSFGVVESVLDDTALQTPNGAPVNHSA